MRSASARVRPLALLLVLLFALSGIGVAAAAGSATATLPGAKPAAPKAAPRRVSSLAGTPGYYPPADPESLAEVVGRRTNAVAVSEPFHGGARSLDALGRAILGALHRQSADSLMKLCVTEDEFRVILWREFPQSRPATGLRWDDAWKMLWARLHAGCSHAVRDYGGHHYEFVRWERSSAEPDTTFRYRNFTLHNRLVLVAKSDEGQLVRMTWLRSAASRLGRFKIYSTDD